MSNYDILSNIHVKRSQTLTKGERSNMVPLTKASRLIGSREIIILTGTFIDGFNFQRHHLRYQPLGLLGANSDVHLTDQSINPGNTSMTLASGQHPLGGDLSMQRTMSPGLICGCVETITEARSAEALFIEAIAAIPRVGAVGGSANDTVGATQRPSSEWQSQLALSS